MRVQAAEKPYEVTIIGGGALGSAMAWEASSRGLRTALVEREDFGCATSANSLRIVHGGLRYLQKMDLRRARRSAAERSALLRIAPHLVRPLQCAIPTLHSWTRGRSALGAGLMLNSLLTLDRNRGIEPECRLPAGGLMSLERFSRLARGIPRDGWSGGAYWFDAIMLDSERLCLEFVMSAKAQGALVLNHAQAVGLNRSGEQENTVDIRDELSGTTTNIRTKLTIDCRGLAASAEDEAGVTRGFDTPPRAAVKAVNVILDAPRTGCAVGFPARDERGRPMPGRLFFALPYHGALAVGTWYFPVESTASRLSTSSLTQSELAEILRDLAASTEWNVGAEHVLSVHAGLLPRCTDSPNPAPVDRPSIARVADSQDQYGLWRVCTEKWTTVRGLAEVAIDTISRQDILSATPSKSRCTPLRGARFDDIASLQAEARSRQAPHVDESVIDRLTTRYGRNALRILHQISADPSLAERMPDYPEVTRAEVAYSAKEELAYTLGDLVLRRLGLGATGCPPAESLAFAAEVMGDALSWSDEDRAANVEAVQRYRGFHVV